MQSFCGYGKFFDKQIDRSPPGFLSHDRHTICEQIATATPSATRSNRFLSLARCCDECLVRAKGEPLFGRWGTLRLRPAEGLSAIERDHLPGQCRRRQDKAQ